MTIVMDNQKRRNNHYIPIMLLRNFTDKDGNLYSFDRRSSERRILTTIPKRLYVKRDLYTQCDEYGNRDDSAERLFAELEGETAPVLEKIINAGRAGKEPTLTSSERETLDHYSYCQWARVPDTAYPVLDGSSKKSSFQEEVRDLSDKELAKFKKEVLVEGFVSDINEPGQTNIIVSRR